MEPRSATAHYDKASDRYTFYAGNQGVFGLKHQMAALLNIKPQQMRVLTGNVGGSFGMKGSPFPEYAGLFHASKILGRWTSPYDATVTARLRAAGAIVTAKGNMDEFAMGSSTEFSAYGPTRNP